MLPSESLMEVSSRDWFMGYFGHTRVMTRRETSATTASRGVSCHVKQFVPSPRDIHQPCRKQRPFQQGPGPGCLIWEEGMEHRAVHNWGILVLKPPPPSLPRPIPRSGTTSTTLFPCFSLITLALPEEA